MCKKKKPNPFDSTKKQMVQTCLKFITLVEIVTTPLKLARREVNRQDITIGGNDVSTQILNQSTIYVKRYLDRQIIFFNTQSTTKVITGS